MSSASSSSPTVEAEAFKISVAELPSSGLELHAISKSSKDFHTLFRNSDFRQKCAEARYRSRTSTMKFSLHDVGTENLDKSFMLALFAAKPCPDPDPDAVTEESYFPAVIHTGSGQRYINIQDLKNFVGIDPSDKNGNGKVCGGPM